jgi:transposase
MRGKTYRRFSTEFKLGVVEAYLAGEGGLKGLGTKAGVDHSLVHYWLKKYHAGELSLDLQREEESVEMAQHIAALERKVGRLTMELDLPKKGAHRRPRDEQRAVVDHLRAGGLSAGRGCRMIGLPRSTYYRRPRERDAQTSDPDAELRAAITQVQRDFPGYGYRRITRELRAGPHRANHKRVQRVIQPCCIHQPPVVAPGSSRSRTPFPERGIRISAPASSQPARINLGSPTSPTSY